LNFRVPADTSEHSSFSSDTTSKLLFHQPTIFPGLPSFQAVVRHHPSEPRGPPAGDLQTFSFLLGHNPKASPTFPPVFPPYRQWSDKIEASPEALQQEKAEKEKQLAESQRDCEHLRNALAAERSALASQRSQRESDVAMLVRQVAGLQQQLQRAEDMKNQALRSADEHSQREDHLLREVCVLTPFFHSTRCLTVGYVFSFFPSRIKNL
jgi:hypothetical protein